MDKNICGHSKESYSRIARPFVQVFAVIVIVELHGLESPLMKKLLSSVVGDCQMMHMIF